MDGGKRGQVVKVCADPACRIHHPNTPSPQQVERERAEERKRIEKEKLAITTRHRILATILQRVSAPLKKADLLAVAHYLIGHLSYSQVPALAKRHKVEAKKDSASAQELLAKQVGTYDEAELCKLLLEISLLDSAYQRSTASRDDVLMDAAKRYRVDTEKLQKGRGRGTCCETRQKDEGQSKAEGPQDGGIRSIALDFWRSASLHSAIFIAGGDEGRAVDRPQGRAVSGNSGQGESLADPALTPLSLSSAKSLYSSTSNTPTCSDRSPSWRLLSSTVMT